MARKTIQVDGLVDWVNAQMERPDSQWNNADTRNGLSIMLEHILHETGNYHGFNYVEWRNGGCERWREDGSPADNTPYLGDQSRKFYY